MELTLIARILLRRWWLILLPVVVTAVFTVPAVLRPAPTGATSFTTTLRYTAAQVLEAIPGRDGDFQDVWLASELTVNAFTEWVRSTRFAEEVAAAAAEQGLTIDPGALVIRSDNERSIGQVFINWPNEAELTVLIEATMTVLQTRNQDYFPQLGSVPAQVEILDEPRITPAPPPLPDRFRPLIQLALALIAGAALAFLADYLDPSLHDRRDVDAAGLKVIAAIPQR